MEKSQVASGVCGVGPAERTGKPRSRYCPGGILALRSLFWRRPRNPREMIPSLISLPPDFFSHSVPHYYIMRLREGLSGHAGQDEPYLYYPFCLFDRLLSTPSSVYGRLQASQRLLHRKRAGSAHNALDRGRRSRLRWLVHGSHLSPVLTRESLSPSLFTIITSHPHCIIPICSRASCIRSHGVPLSSGVLCAKTQRRVSLTWASTARAGEVSAIGLSSTRSCIAPRCRVPLTG